MRAVNCLQRVRNMRILTNLVERILTTLLRGLDKKQTLWQTQVRSPNKTLS
jgi:hypothetical protein